MTIDDVIDRFESKWRVLHMNMIRVVVSKFSVPGVFLKKNLTHLTNLYQNGQINLN